MGIVEAIALSMGAAWASGINLYAALLTLGLLGATDSIVLPPALEILAHPGVIMAAGFMYFVEFFTDKTPGVDTGWDTMHTFIRIPAGAVLAAGALGDVAPAAEVIALILGGSLAATSHATKAGGRLLINASPEPFSNRAASVAEDVAVNGRLLPAAAVIALILGGSLAATSHATKAGGRLLINASPEPFSNWTASVAEDVAVIGGLWLALQTPWLFLGLLVLFLVAVAWLLPKLLRGIRALFSRLGRLISGDRRPAEEQPREAQPERRMTLTLREAEGGTPGQP